MQQLPDYTPRIQSTPIQQIIPPPQQNPSNVELEIVKKNVAETQQQMQQYMNQLTSLTEKWTQIVSTSSLSEQTSSPSGRRSHSAIVYIDKIIIFGGFKQSDNPTHFNDLYEFDSGMLKYNKIYQN